MRMVHVGDELCPWLHLRLDWLPPVVVRCSPILERMRDNCSSCRAPWIADGQVDALMRYRHPRPAGRGPRRQTDIAGFIDAICRQRHWDHGLVVPEQGVFTLTSKILLGGVVVSQG